VSRHAQAKALAEATAFFREHAGYSYDAAHGETRERGRTRCARDLALAEQRARDVGLICVWATTGYSDPYRRVVEAELALEALALLDQEADEKATIAADELAQRATFAGPSNGVTP
jgi:hypothetical protein